MKKKPRIFVSIPSLMETMNICFLSAFQKWCESYKIFLDLALHRIPLDHARNVSIDRFLREAPKRDFTHYLGVDADMAPTKDCLAKLLAADKDCISPVIFTIKPDVWRRGSVPIPVPVIRYKNGENGLTKKDIVESGVLPGGMYLLKRHVLEKIKKPAFKYRYNKRGYLKAGTDMYFSDKLMKHGFKLWIHNRALCEQSVTVGSAALNETMLRYGRILSSKKEG